MPRASSTAYRKLVRVCQVRLLRGSDSRSLNEPDTMENQPQGGKTVSEDDGGAISPASQCSGGMMCGVCLEVVCEKVEPSERQFAILPNCFHCFCVGCIYTWRRTKSENCISCPECRTTSEFYVRSDVWIRDEQEKQRLIQDKRHTIPCPLFKGGRGLCPYGSLCWYKHQVGPATSQYEEENIETDFMYIDLYAYENLSLDEDTSSDEESLSPDDFLTWDST